MAKRRNSRLSLKLKLFSKSSVVRVRNQKCVGGEPNLNETKINSHSGSDICFAERVVFDFGPVFFGFGC